MALGTRVERYDVDHRKGDEKQGQCDDQDDNGDESLAFAVDFLIEAKAGEPLLQLVDLRVDTQTERHDDHVDHGHDSDWHVRGEDDHKENVW